jgi:hypothetical protein
METNHDQQKGSVFVMDFPKIDHVTVGAKNQDKLG